MYESSIVLFQDDLATGAAYQVSPTFRMAHRLGIFLPSATLAVEYRLDSVAAPTLSNVSTALSSVVRPVPLQPQQPLPALPHTRIHCLALSGIQGNAEEGLQVSFVVRERGQLRQPPPIDDRAVAANKVMDMLGFESGRLYSEDSYIVELAKWGFAAITRIRQATQDLSELTPSSVPPHVTAMLGEVQELFELTSRSAALLNVPNLQSLCAFEGSSFDNNPTRFDPIPELLGMDTAGIEYYLAEKHPSGDRRIKNGTLYLVYITMSKLASLSVGRRFALCRSASGEGGRSSFV
eukprot:g71558.t1